MKKRNSILHDIEKPSERFLARKPRISIAVQESVMILAKILPDEEKRRNQFTGWKLL